MQTGVRPWEVPEHRAYPTLSRAAFKTYSTYVWPYIQPLDCTCASTNFAFSTKPKIAAWIPTAAPR